MTPGAAKAAVSRFVVLDTNVLVSAGISREGAPAVLVMDWLLERRIQIVTSPIVIEEYRLVMGRAKFQPYGFPPRWLEFVISESLHLEEPPSWPNALPDEEDAPFLALAHAAGAGLITGNLKHFPRSSRGGVVVLSPSEYLDQLLKTFE